MRRNNSFTEQDKKFMRLALRFASRGRGKVEPNPLVGAVIVKNDRVASRGWHRFFGGPHAEADAIGRLIKRTSRRWEKILKGATLYVNLEPCCHKTPLKKTPPCVPLIIKSGIARVVVGMTDPNPLVSGKGLAQLRRAGISITRGVLQEECAELNKVYIKNIRTSMPYVILKTAMTLDGKIATSDGDSKWITSDASRHYVHKLRSQVDAVLVGVNTIIKDNPLLTSHGEGKDPVRIIIDKNGIIPEEAKIFSAGTSEIILVTTPHGKKRLLNKKFPRIPHILSFDTNGVRMISFRRIMKEIYKKFNIRTLLIEGGGDTNWSAIKSGVVDEYLFFIAPKILGGKNSLTPVEGEGYKKIKFSQQIEIEKVFRLGNDIVISGKAIPK